MPSPSNISVFTQIDALENIEVPLLCGLVARHEEHFRSTGLELNDEDKTQDTFPYQEFSNAIREIEDKDELLIETLFLVESIYNANAYDSVQEQLSRLEIKYKGAIDNYAKNKGIEHTLSDIGRIVVLVFCGGLSDLHDLAVFAASQHSKGFREYPILISDSNQQYSEDESEESKPIELSVIKERANNQNSFIENTLFSRNIKSLCFIHTYLSEKTNSIWFFVEYGGRFTQIDQYETSGKPSKLKYQQLTRDIIIYDIERQVLSVKAQGKWKEEMYRKFSGLVISDSEDYFVDASVYSLDPLFTQNLRDLLACRNVNKEIARVQLRTIFCHVNTANGIVNQKLFKQTGNGLLEFWDEVRKNYYSIASAAFMFKFRGYSSEVTATIHNNRGLNVVHAKYKTAIQQFFQRKGFELSHQPQLTISSIHGDCWDGLLSLFSHPLETSEKIYSLCGSKLGAYIIQESIEETDDFKDVWIDANGTCYKVIEDNHRYSLFNESETTEPTLPQISPEFVEVYEFLPLDFLKRIAKVLVPYTKQDFTSCKDGNQCFQINSYYPYGVDCWIYAPNGKDQLELSPIFKNRVPERNADVVFGFTQEPPPQWREFANAFQWVFIGDILEVTDKHELAYKSPDEQCTSIRDYTKPASYETNINRRWPYIVPPDTTWKSVHIQLLHGCKLKIRLGVDEEELDPRNLEMFKNTRNESGLNKKFSCLIKMLRLAESIGQFKLAELDKNYYPDLLRSFSCYFGIQETFLTKDDKTKKYKLDFGSFKCELDMNGYDFTS